MRVCNMESTAVKMVTQETEAKTDRHGISEAKGKHLYHNTDTITEERNVPHNHPVFKNPIVKRN